jgi:hypothetical protein
MGPSRSPRGSVFQYQTFEKPFNYQTFDWHNCQFTDHPINPSDRRRFNSRFTDDDDKSDAEFRLDPVPKDGEDDLGAEKLVILEDPLDVGMLLQWL